MSKTISKTISVIFFITMGFTISMLWGFLAVIGEKLSTLPAGVMLTVIFLISHGIFFSMSVVDKGTSLSAECMQLGTGSLAIGLVWIGNNINSGPYDCGDLLLNLSVLVVGAIEVVLALESAMSLIDAKYNAKKAADE